MVKKSDILKQHTTKLLYHIQYILYILLWSKSKSIIKFNVVSINIMINLISIYCNGDCCETISTICTFCYNNV